MHGLNHLIVSRTSKMRLFWGLVLLGALAGLIMHSQTVAALYMSRPISIEMQYSLDKEPLPAITVCPSSLTSYYHLYLKKRGLSAFNWNLLTDWNLARLLETALTPFWKQIYGLQMSMLNISDHKDRNFNMPLDVQLFRYASIVDSFAQFLSQLKYQNVTRNRAHNMIFACEFSYQLCNFTSFTLTYHPIYKTCFTYRYSPANHRLGFPEFLSLITLANDIPEYSRGFNSAPINMYRGGVFEVHSFETAPTMTQPYPFTKAYRQLVAITKTEDRIVNSALYPCLDQSDTEKIVLVEESIRFDGNETANETSYRYSHELCQQLQLQATVIERCHCVSPLLPVSKQQQQQLSRGTNVIFKCGRMPATLLRNGISFSQNSSDFFVTVSEGDATSTTAKLLDYLDSVEGGRHFLDSLVCQTKTLINDTVKQRSRQRCLERCNKISYKLKLNSNTFDHFYETYAMINLFNNHFTLTNINGPLEHVFDYYIRAYFSTAYVFQRLSAFYFYFKSSETKTVTQTDSYTLTSMLSDLGGVLGLWFGVSIATVFELLELAIMLFVYRT